MDQSPTTPTKTTEDGEIERSLRPGGFSDFIGQSKLKENLEVFIQAATARGDSLDHILFYGPPGLGKTTLSNIIASELGVNIKSIAAPVLERPGDLAAILTDLSPFDVLFIDEIHRLNRMTEELLYLAMEDFKLDILIGNGPSAKNVRIDLPKFTLVGATTRAGQLTSPLRDRFGIVNRMDFYTQEEMQQIVKRAAGILCVQIDEFGIEEIARRSRGTPRISNRLLKRIRDFAQVKGDGKITKEITCLGLDALEVDEYGLDAMDRKIMETLIDKFRGGPVGLNTLTIAVSEETITVEDVYEPYLVKIGFLERTPRGRKATELAYKYFKRDLWSR
ncbi:MAG: Holliday junction branch migration DNA helicase RuvB [bacterium]|nr:Holliday junction branch migration DNA helicase RuvB [bacterium]